MNRGWLVSTLGFAGLLGLACGDGGRDELPPVTQTSRRIALAAPGLELCAGTLAKLDAHVARLEAAVALERSGRARVYVLDDAALVDEICGGSQRGRCYDGELRASVVARDALADGAIEHELVHDFADHTRIGALPPLLAEGLATLLSWEWAPRTAPSTAGVSFLLDVGPNASLKNDEYVLGALFLNHLFGRFPRSAVVDFLAALERADTSGPVNTAAVAHLGQPLERLEAEYDASEPSKPACTRCRTPARTVDGTSSVPVRFDCSSPDTSDDFAAPFRLRVNQVIDLERDFTFSLDVPSELNVRVASCDCEVPESTKQMGLTQGARVMLARGSYSISVTGPRELDGSSRIIAFNSVED